MTVATQNRLPLHRAVQQHDASLMAQVVSLQMQAFAAAGALGAEYDIAVCDATAGAFTLDLPAGAEVYIGKEYSVKETSGANAVTVRGYGGAGTIDGGATLVVPARQAAVFVATEISAAGAATWQKVSSSSSTGADATAIHVDIANEIGGITAKAAPTILDVGVIEDAAAAGVKKSIVLGAIMKAVGWVAGLTAKTLPIGADLVAIEDSAAAGAIKKSTLAQFFGVISSFTAKAAPVAADTIAINDSAAAGAAKVSTIGSIPIAQAQVRKILLRPAADGAVTLLPTTGGVELEISAAGTVVIATDPTCYRGQEVSFRAKAVAGGGSYTLDLGGGTNLVINATGEAPRVMRSETDTWVVMGLEGATIV
jgi:hypothetical protein